MAAVAILVLAALYLLLNVALNTPQGIGRISRLLSETLHQPATVEKVSLSGGTIAVGNLAIGNPTGFARGNLLTARSIRVTPSWGALLFGRKSFSNITVRGLNLTIAKNSAGAWNFSGLTRLSSGKKGGAETFIKRLVLEDSAISVNGRGVSALSLAINDLSTRGTTGSRILLSFKDKFNASYRLAGSARLGPNPDGDLEFSAQDFTFKALRGVKVPLDPEKGGGKALVRATLHGDILKLNGNASFAKLTLRLKGNDVPLSGALNFSGGYDIKKDSAVLDRCELRLDGLLRLQGRGHVDGVKKERVFMAQVDYDGIDLAKAFALLPQKIRRDFSPSGQLLPGTIRVAGSGASGVTSGHVALYLRNGRLDRGKRVLADGVAADALLDREKAGWTMCARLSEAGKGSALPVNFTDIPVTALFDERFRPVRADIPSFAVSYEGIRIRGEASYRRDGAVPLAARLEMTDAPLTTLAGMYPVKDVAVSQGTLSAKLRASGSGPADFRSDIVAGLRNFQGSYAGKKMALAGLAVQGDVVIRGGKRNAVGTLKADGGVYDGKKIAASLGWRASDGTVTLSGGDLSMDRTRLGFAQVSGAIPRKVVTPEGSRLPLAFRFNGVSFRRDDNGVDALSGELNAALITAQGNRRLEGRGSFSAQNLVYAGKGAGSLAGRFDLAGGKGAAEITGKLLDGALTASLNGDPFAPGREISFTADLTGVAGSRLADLLGKGRPVQISAGTLTAAAKGNYCSGKGLRCRLDLSGGKLALAGKKGKTILSDGGLKIAAQWENGDILVNSGLISVGNGPALSLKGKIAAAAKPERDGELDLTLNRASLASFFDAFANILPRALQEATASGDVAADGRMRIRGKQAAVAGKITLDGGALDIPGQKLKIADMSGVVPYSIDFSGGVTAKQPDRLSFSKENYPKLLPLMERMAEGEHNLTIGRISYGATEFGATALNIRAANGQTEISSLASGLFQGQLLGRGFVRYQAGVQYGADIMVHDLSLRELCNTYPSIKGYLSGRIDGFLSLLGTTKGLNDMKGVLAVWARDSRDEKMQVSKEFLQKLAGRNIRGMFFQTDRRFDRGEIDAFLEKGFLTFQTLDISHTNFLGIRDLSVSVAPVQNKISLDHLFTTIREAASRGKAATGGPAAPAAAPSATEFKWEE
ncbi:MAG TPA: hypothetical protein VF799_00540 [Geobacteraceae bacterium]